MTYLDLNPVRARLSVTPLEYRWCGHRALRDENAAELDSHPLYLGLGPTQAGRYERYLRLVAEDARRPALSLARVYFVGTRRFVSQMEQRFGLAAGGAWLKRSGLGADAIRPVISAEPRRGGGNASK